MAAKDFLLLFISKDLTFRASSFWQSLPLKLGYLLIYPSPLSTGSEAPEGGRHPFLPRRRSEITVHPDAPAFKGQPPRSALQPRISWGALQGVQAGSSPTGLPCLSQENRPSSLLVTASWLCSLEYLPHFPPVLKSLLFIFLTSSNSQK